MRKILTALTGSLAILLAITGCYSDNEYDLYPFASCDSINVTYTGTIAPIMTTSCNVCHSSALASGNVVTDNYAGLRAVAGDGRLWGVLSHAQGFPPMPKNAAQLTTCDLAKVNHWIKAGFPEN